MISILQRHLCISVFLFFYTIYYYFVIIFYKQIQECTYCFIAIGNKGLGSTFCLLAAEVSVSM